MGTERTPRIERYIFESKASTLPPRFPNSPFPPINSPARERAQLSATGRDREETGGEGGVERKGGCLAVAATSNSSVVRRAAGL